MCKSQDGIQVFKAESKRPYPLNNFTNPSSIAGLWATICFSLEAVNTDQCVKIDSTKMVGCKRPHLTLRIQFSGRTWLCYNPAWRGKGLRLVEKLESVNDKQDKLLFLDIKNNLNYLKSCQENMNPEPQTGVSLHCVSHSAPKVIFI